MIECQNVPAKPHILGLSTSQLKEMLSTICSKPYTIKQILQWIYHKYIIDFQSMTNISKQTQSRLADTFDCSLPQITQVQTSADTTTKFLLKLHDDTHIEMVYIPAEKKNTLCISTQVGCSRGCRFCATANMGLIRNLTTAEILSQILIAHQYFPDKKLTNIVLMGMGEPLDNFDNVLFALKTLQDPDGFSFSGRRVTLSTSGVVPKIYDITPLCEGGGGGEFKLKLAISLNSAIDEKRTQIMPINALYPLAKLKKAIQNFRRHSHFRVTFEYIMIANFNMGREDIKALAKFCGDISCKINLIKWNEVAGLPWKSPTDEQVARFIEQASHIPAAITLRKSRGSDIAGACGQLVAYNSQSSRDAIYCVSTS